MEEDYLVTVSHQEIKEWVEARNGRPAFVESLSAGGDKKGLRVDFPGQADEAFLSEGKPSIKVTWEEFFEEFEKQQLAFLYNNVTPPADAYRFLPRRV